MDMCWHSYLCSSPREQEGTPKKRQQVYQITDTRELLY